MKKLMLAMAVVAAGLSVNAATIKWNSGTIYNQAGTKANAKTAIVSATLYSLTSAQYTSATSMTAADLYKAATGGTYGTAVTSASTTALGLANLTQTVTGGSTESPATYYGLVVYTDAVSADGPWVKTAVKSATFQDDGQVSFTGLASGVASWTAAPEPTSGLLLLLGMAGLALKRKIA